MTPLVGLQSGAYACNREPLGAEPLPLLVDYHAVLDDNEVRVLDCADDFDAALVLEPRAGDLTHRDCPRLPWPGQSGGQFWQ